MNQDVLMLLRYAAMLYGMYAFSGNQEMIEPFVGLVLAAAAAGWGVWTRLIHPWLIKITAKIKDQVE